jgi:hypothetical protein
MDVAKRMAGLVLLTGFSISALYGENTHTRAREYFFLAGEDPCKAERLIEITESDPSPQQVILAYRGAAYAMLADCVKAPWEKLEFFNKGKQIIEKAIQGDAGSPEIRFIRFMVQDRAPAFLRYDNRREDLSILLDAFAEERITETDQDFVKKMAAAVAASDFPDEAQKTKISGFIDGLRASK